MGASDSQTGHEHGRCQEHARSHDQMMDEITAIQLTCSGDIPEYWSSRSSRPTYDPHVAEEAVVYISRRYEDSWDEEQPWLHERRLPDELEWYATTGGTAGVDAQAEFDSVDDAITWGRERARIVLVKLGGDVEAIYSAGI